MAAGDGGDVRFSVGIDTAGASEAFRKLEQMSAPAAKKAISAWTRELGSLDTATAKIAEQMLKMAGKWDERVVVLKRAEVQLKRELDLQRQIADQAERRAKANRLLGQTRPENNFVSSKDLRASASGINRRLAPGETYGPTLTPQQRRAIEFANKKAEADKKAAMEAERVAKLFDSLADSIQRDAYGPQLPPGGVAAIQARNAADEQWARTRASMSYRNVNDYGYYYQNYGMPGAAGGPGGPGRRSGGGGVAGRAAAVAGGGFLGGGGRGQAAIQQGIFAIDDFVTSLGTGGLSGAVRGASNNITAMASLMGGPWGLGIAVAATAVTQLAINFTDLGKMMEADTKKAEALKKAEEDLVAARSKSTQAAKAAADALSGAGLSSLGAVRGGAMQRSAALREASAEGLGVAEQMRMNRFGRAGFAADTGESLLRRMTQRYSSGETNWWGGGETFRRRTDVNANQDVSGSRGFLRMIRTAQALDAETREAIGLDDERLNLAMLDYNAQRDLAFAGSQQTLSLAAEGRRQGRGLLGGLDYGGRGAELGAQMDDISFLFDDATQKMLENKMSWDDYQRTIAELIPQQNALNKEIKAFATEQGQLAALYSRRRGDLDSFLGSAGGRFAEDRQRQEMGEFIRGGILAGLDEAELRTMAYERFGTKEADPLGEDGILSKATIGANAARSGGDEFARLLSGDDAGRKLVTINEEQLAAQRQTNALLDEQLEIQLEVAN